MRRNQITVTHSAREWAELFGINYYTLLARLRRGWSIEKAIATPLLKKGGGRRTHGCTGSKEYRAWKSMIYRCESPTYHAANRYSRRGISVCQRWRESFEAFLADVGPAPSPALSLGRIDNNGNYCPGNVAWQTTQQQARNRATPVK